MNEMELRRAVYRLRLNPNTKCALLGVMCFVNWERWIGPCSAKDISKAMCMHESSVRRALKELISLRLIRRTAKKRKTKVGKIAHHRAETQVNVSLIMSQAEAVEDDDGDNGDNGDNGDPHPLSHNATTPSRIMRPPPLAHSDHPLSHNATAPLSHNATHPLSHNATHTIEDKQQRTTMEVSIEEGQPSHGSEPDQNKGVSGGAEGSADDALYSKRVIEYAKFTGRTLKQAQEHIRLGSAEPDQRGEAQEVSVDNGDYPDDVIEYAEMTGQTPQQVEEQARNAKKRMELRRARERGNDHNQPTTAYRPKPKLY